jgi:hypothetical protein
MFNTCSFSKDGTGTDHLPLSWNDEASSNTLRHRGASSISSSRSRHIPLNIFHAMLFHFLALHVLCLTLYIYYIRVYILYEWRAKLIAHFRAMRKLGSFRTHLSKAKAKQETIRITIILSVAHMILKINTCSI